MTYLLKWVSFFNWKFYGRVSFFSDKSAMHWGKTLVRPPRIKIWKALVFLRIKKWRSKNWNGGCKKDVRTLGYERRCAPRYTKKFYKWYGAQFIRRQRCHCWKLRTIKKTTNSNGDYFDSARCQWSSTVRDAICRLSCHEYKQDTCSSSSGTNK